MILESRSRFWRVSIREAEVATAEAADFVFAVVDVAFALALRGCSGCGGIILMLDMNTNVKDDDRKDWFPEQAKEVVVYLLLLVMREI